MRRMVVMVGLAAVSAASAATANVEQERTALMQRDRDWSASTKDANRFVSFFAADASMYPPGMPVVTGADAIRQAWAGMSGAPGFALRWTAAEAQVSSSGDLGYTTGAYEATMGGLTEKGKYVTLWKKDGAEWKVTRDIFNADGPAPEAHAVVTPADIKWIDAPGLPPGAKLAVITGDPSKPEPFVIRGQVPAGYKIPAHWHPGHENVTVLSGTIAIGMGEKWDDAKLQTIAAGGYAALPAEMRHFFLAKTASTFQVHGMGPFIVNYVNPADAPQKKE